MSAAVLPAATASRVRGNSGLIDALSARVRERVRVVKSGDVAAGGGGVVYWMRSALRGHENPALDAALLAGYALGVAVTVFLHIEDRYPWATARRQRFLLEGARSAQAELQRRGVTVLVQVDRTGQRRPSDPKQPSPLLHMLARSACLVVAEEPFCVPWIAGVEALGKAGDFDAPIWLVDCASIVPSALVPAKACHRAYTFEDASKTLHAERLHSPWQEVKGSLPVVGSAGGAKGALPCELFDQHVDLLGTDLDALLQQTEVDFSVSPVTHTIGGSRAGYERWATWLAAGGLKDYAKRRNDSLDPNGVSRMSAYLNLGMVSPMRIAHEARATSGAGKSKFLHELLTWRGVAYAHCYHFPMPASGATLSQLPSWAQATLRAHAADPRPAALPRKQLAEGRTGDRAWDSMQQYLAQTGELHNNARMGWGKAFLFWTSSPEEALDALLDLNNSFALDGHAPPSYAGVLGSLGLFEGPKQERAIVGKIAYKPPKPRYASMMEVCFRQPCPSGTNSRKRRWKIALKPQGCIDLTME